MAELVTRCAVGWRHSRCAGQLAVLTLDNGAKRPNTLGAGGLASLDAALERVEDADCQGLVLTGRPGSFAAGADLTALAGVTVAAAHATARRGQQVFARLRALRVPTVAAINGPCLGGGLELALHCDARTLSTAAAAIGSPEVALSLVPGWGGTQLAPRLLGAAGALTLIVHHPLDANRVLTPAEAAALGLADLLVEPPGLLDASVRLLEDLVVGERVVSREAGAGDGLEQLLAAARAAADRHTFGATPAPYRAVDLIEHAARGGELSAGLHAEADAFADLATGRHAQASLYAFDLVRSRIKRRPGPPTAPPRAPREVGVVDGGQRGPRIAALLRERGTPVTVVSDRAGAGRLRGVDAVIVAGRCEAEAVRQTLGAVEAVVDDDCLLAVTVCAAPVAPLAAELSQPRRLVGLHFVDPPREERLVELVTPPGTREDAAAAAIALTAALGVPAVRCGDTPGFVVQRLLARVITVGLQTADPTGQPGFAAVDDAVRALGLPAGPFALLDALGPCRVAAVTAALAAAHPARYASDPNLEMLCAREARAVHHAHRVAAVPDEVRRAWRRPADWRPQSPAQRQRLLLRALADECRRMLDEGTVADARDIDTCMLVGARWPFFLGGICRHLDQVGISTALFGAPLIGAADAAGEQRTVGAFRPDAI